MVSIVSIDLPFSVLGLRRVVDTISGQPIDGRWEGTYFRLWYQRGVGWALSLYLQAMGESAYQILATTGETGYWTEVGVYETQVAALQVARDFMEGRLVWREAYRTMLGTVCASVVAADNAYAELARGEAPRGPHA